MIRQAVVFAFVGSLGLSVQAPVQPQSTPKFEVVSIKLNTTTTMPLNVAFLRTAGAGNAKNGRFWMVGDIAAAPLSVLIQIAYNINDFQLDGGPSWVRSDRYEVDARAQGPATLEQMRLMLQSLLADRFKLTLRRETRQLPVYDLMPAKDGLRIAQMKEGSCVTPEQAVPFGPISWDQKTKPGTTKHNPVRSAKPPSPVQIRAAGGQVPVTNMIDDDGHRAGTVWHSSR